MNRQPIAYKAIALPLCYIGLATSFIARGVEKTGAVTVLYGMGIMRNESAFCKDAATKTLQLGKEGIEPPFVHCVFDF